ncbi:MAG: Hsp20/alpha crystallin family protein [candidate division KSB1 bacterium]|nr:Hsp20/alpha crystallin family protein [candidate division KSB1 bacterium]MDZ7336491.1 Hsp20/alpha crystallin family protein [candidate division KSB1 bacterium]MDZ7356927.1 Hsp20/alpha crystallin family protein [candidate division KSB1 bacterium]MDZ7375180.1 Hsp20/alpha crystallin family protein [candidate division KSB1 bacterium]MDZ7399242.1 Hsp20/alpha crystallin family protein [candidate division KSB1 bacterium]
MPVVRWRPLDEFRNLREEMDRRLQKFYRTVEENSEGICDCYPLVDIEETKDEFIIYAELPGVSAEDVKINMADETLTISGEVKEPDRMEERRFHRVERTYGKFQRSFYLPVPIEGEKVKASFKNGILTINLPKKEEVKPKEITISVS